MKIVVDNKIPFINGVLEPFGTIKYLQGKEITRDEVIDADALVIRTRTECTRELLEGTSVKFIASATIGYDHIDMDYCHKHNITWTNAPGCNARSVQQYVASALYFLAAEHKFDPEGITIGIIGVGNVGKKIEALARNLSMKVLLNDPPRERNEGPGQFASLERILTESDIVTLHVPLHQTGIDKTLRMVDQSFLDKMKNGSYLINTSRGKVVDEDSLKKALTSSRLKGAILDVWDNEPDLDNELLKMAFIGTPHIAGYSQDGKANGTSVCVQSLSWYFNFGLEDWYPDSIPPPTPSQFILDCEGKDRQTIIREAILKTYEIGKDHMRLLQSPHKFEELRGNYPVRREYPAYTLNLVNTDEKIKKTLMNLGFNINTEKE